MRVPAATKTKRQVAGAPYDRPPSSLPQTKPKATTGKQGSQPSAQDPENLDLGQADESEEMRVEREWIVSQLEDLECAAGIRDTRSSESSSWDTIHTRLFALQKTVGDLLSSNESLSRHADMIELERDDALRRVKEMDTLVRRFEEENAAMRGWGEEMKRQRDERGMAWKAMTQSCLSTCSTFGIPAPTILPASTSTLTSTSTFTSASTHPSYHHTNPQRRSVSAPFSKIHQHPTFLMNDPLQPRDHPPYHPYPSYVNPQTFLPHQSNGGVPRYMGEKSLKMIPCVCWRNTKGCTRMGEWVKGYRVRGTRI